ncbi:MAG: hypothetical protein JO062_03375 [Bryobacterales bacterium]|nr:hypothetical protein [Bryobacterales bacterium]
MKQSVWGRLQTCGGLPTRLALFSLLLGLAPLLQAQSNPRVLYTKSFPGSVPAYVAITIDSNGVTTYNESKDEDNAEKLQLERDVTASIFDLATRLDYFKHALESGLKVANLGAKTYRWEAGADTHEVTFNFSQDENAKLLQDWFERITDSERAYLELDRAAKHDRLGVHQAMLQIVNLWDNKRLVGTQQMLPLLDRVAKNEAFINMARERAAAVAAAIRAKSKAE